MFQGIMVSNHHRLSGWKYSKVTKMSWCEEILLISSLTIQLQRFTEIMWKPWLFQMNIFMLRYPEYKPLIFRTLGNFEKFTFIFILKVYKPFHFRHDTVKLKVVQSNRTSNYKYPMGLCQRLSLWSFKNFFT